MLSDWKKKKMFLAGGVFTKSHGYRFVFLWLGVMGAVVAPLAFLGGPLLIRAAWYTAGIVGGLSTVAMCAPSEKFLNMGGPLGIGLGFVLASSIGKILF